ncbi:hypothetical protein F4553_000488 [Allocatelliglobosispora scoriae]|uniref:F5/8 type C domain-containing protein n=1 Tax=Allocatelliglobosispora scoriae TaxID=643052 RepID=A0A841BIW5_9ACTN|nr:DUF1996 domain-containing protein [Allocatelliglobosispora scoriae]MBB5867109.1 hypothetical protein [Allocatelliglobosispora scoriae]
MSTSALTGRNRPRTLVVGVAVTALIGALLTSQALSASAAETPLSQGRPATASSTENGGTPASAAVDGNLGTRWASAFSDPQWLQVDLGATAAINRVVITWETAYAPDFTIQTSANGTAPWTTINTTVNGTGGVQTLNVTGSGRYVRLNTTRRATQYGASVWEFQVFGTGGAQPSPSPSNGAGWIKMDQTAWAAQLAEFNAMVMNPAPPNAVRVSEFNASCVYSHSFKDDPIVFPGLPGASHMHSFFGNRSTNANTTTASLRANTAASCGPVGDPSAYWIPTLYQNGVAIEPRGVTVYYSSRLPDPTKTVPFPQGFRMIAGDAKRQVPTPAGAPGQFWCAGIGGEIGRSADGNWPVCAQTANLTYQLVFQDCWDGIHLDSPDHKSHVSYNTVNGKCAGDYPVAIPNVSFVIDYPTHGSAAGYTLSSGMASSIHGDSFLAWDNAAMGHRVKDCIVQKAKCNTAGTF